MSSLEAVIDDEITKANLFKSVKTTKPVKIDYDNFPLHAIYTAVATFGAAYCVKLFGELIFTYN